MTSDVRRNVIFLTSVTGDLLAASLSSLATGKCVPDVVRSLDELTQMPAEGRTLLSYGTSVIVPAGMIERFEGRAYNLHAASPEFPGRDPHHFAIYAGVNRYGATLHVMMPKVDEGQILNVEWFDVDKDETPYTLLERANQAAMRLLKRYSKKLEAGLPLVPSVTAPWGTPKRSRADFQAMCTLDASIDAEEFQRRFRAFDGGPHNNLTLKLHGRTFRIDKSVEKAD
jgi:methionyl-tRNA formyltransferase